jgi:arylsulfatase A-like enzyme
MERNADKPFFVYVPYTMPHTPLFASKEFAGTSLAGRYGDVVEEIDASAGAIREAVERLGLDHNTLIVFTSDNGPWLTMFQEGGSAGLLRMGKGSTFEGGMRVPAVFYWPGRIKPTVIRDIGSTLDIYNTALTLADLPVKADSDSIDLSPALFEQAPSPRSELAYYRRGTLYAYRVGDWKLHYIIEGAYGQPPLRTDLDTPALYNLKRDPGEQFDIADAHPDVVAHIQQAVARHKEGLQIQPPLLDLRLQALIPAAD